MDDITTSGAIRANVKRGDRDVPERSYIHIIQAIDDGWRDGTPFSIAEVRARAGRSESATARLLRKLVYMKIVTHSKRAFAGRHYRIAERWTTAKDVIETYEMFKLIEEMENVR